MDKRRSFWERIWKNKDGSPAVWQVPNLTLWLWLALGAINFLAPEGTFKHTAEITARCVLFAWAWMELLEGESYFRRFLGLTVALVTLMSLYRLAL